MKEQLKGLYNILVMFGFDPRKTLYSLMGLVLYFKDLKFFMKQKKTSAVEFPFGKPYPCLGDRFSESGFASGHYFHQDLLVARRVHLNNPVLHVDIGSRVDGFVAHLASFRALEVFDIRPLTIAIPNITFKQADLMGDLQNELTSYCDSISCLHALEHFGLGRYGDPINYTGHINGFNNLGKILKEGGKFYFSVPIGQQRIEFNAHRVFSLQFLLNLFHEKYRIDHFSFVDDSGNLHEDIELRSDGVSNNFGCTYGCGIFELTKT